MPDHPELLPCPFCGEMPKLVKMFDGRTRTIEIQPNCIPGKCHKRGVVTTTTFEELRELAESEAIAAWNTRAAPRWIPVTERLPEIPDNSEWEDRFVLCTFENPDGRRYVLETHYLDGEFSVGDEISIDFTPPNYIGQMYEGKDTKLVAWMYKPLPLPPKEVK